MRFLNLLKKAAVAAAVVAALGAGGFFVAVKVFFPEPKIRAWIVDAARRQTGREVRLERIDVGLRGLTLRGLEVSERPDFSAGTFLRVEGFRLRPSWSALLRKKLVVAAVAADGLKVRVVKRADGHFNFETLLSSAAPAAAASAPAAGAKTPEAAPPELNVRRASVSRGTVEYVDEAAKASWALSEADLDVTDFSQAAPFGLSGSFRVAGKAGSRPVDARVRLDGTVDLARGSREKFKADFKKLSVEAEGLKLSAAVQASGLDAPRLSFDAALSAAGRELLKAAGTAKAGAAADVDVKLKTPGLDTTLLAKLVPGTAIPALAVPAIDADLKGSFGAGAADVRAFSAAWNGGRIEGAGSARGLGGAKPAYEGHVSFGVDLPEVRPGQYPFLKLPPKLSLPAARLDGAASYAGDALKLSSLTVKTKQGTVAVHGTVSRLSSAKPVPDATAVLALDLPAFTAADLPVPVEGLPPGFAVPAGRLEGAVTASGDDVRLGKVSFQAKGGFVRVDGTVAGALAGAPKPDVEAAADLTLPALTDKDLPFPGVPAGLNMPPSHWAAQASYSPRLLRVKSLRLQTGKNDVEVSGTVTDPGGLSAFDMLVKCRSFALEELTQLTPQTRDEKLSGSGFFALAVTGTKSKPVFAGKLQFKGLGATVAGLPLADFTGTASFDAKRLDVPNLTGKVSDGTLKMDLTVKDYSTFPEVQLEASLDRFDLGRYMTAKSKLAADAKAAAAAKPAPAAKAAKAEPEQKTPPISTRGHLEVGTLVHPNATVTDVKVGWNLRGVAADLHGLDGDAKFHVGGGKIQSVGDMAVQSKLVKVLIFPLLVVQKLGRIGGIRLFPDFNNIELNQIVGDYAFKDGVMTLNESEMDSDAARVSATGAIDLPAESLDLVVTAQVANVAPIDVAVTGTFDNPKSKVNLGKFLADPAKQLIQGLIKH
jgi:hypothetical protein